MQTNPISDLAGQFQSEWSDAQQKYSDALAKGIPPTVAERMYLNPVATKWRVASSLLTRQKQLMPKPPTATTPLQAAQLQAQTLKNQKLAQQAAKSESPQPEYFATMKKALSERIVKEMAASTEDDPMRDKAVMVDAGNLARLLTEEKSLQPQPPAEEATAPAEPTIPTATSKDEVSNLPQGSTFYSKGVKGLDDGTLYRKDGLSADQQKMADDAIENFKKTGKLIMGTGALQPSAPATATGTTKAIPAAAIAALRSNPDKWQEFDEKFGKGASNDYLP